MSDIDTVNRALLAYKRKRSQKRKRAAILSALSLLVMTATALWLMLPAITMEAACGMEVHTHGAECYASAENTAAEMICDEVGCDGSCGWTEENAARQHTDECRHETEASGEPTLTCGLPEHQHTPTCYPDGGGLAMLLGLVEQPSADAGICLSAETESGVAVAICAPTASLPFAEEELSLLVCETDAASDARAYERLADDLGLPEEELAARGMRIFSVSLRCDGKKESFCGPVTVTITGLDVSTPTVYMYGEKRQPWREADAVWQTDDGALVFEADCLRLIGVETADEMKAEAAINAMPLRTVARRAVRSEPDTLTVYKIWSDGAGAHTDDEIEVALMYDDGVNSPVMEDCQTLSAATAWQYTFTLQHPMEDNGRTQYTVMEEVPGYQTQYGTIVNASQSGSGEGVWVPADRLEDGEVFAFVSAFSGKTYTPGAEYDPNTNPTSAIYMFALPVTVVPDPITVGQTQYTSYLENVDERATFTAIEQDNGGFLLKNQYTQRFLEPRGYCFLTAQSSCVVDYTGYKIKTRYPTSNNKTWWLMQYNNSGISYDYTGTNSQQSATSFLLYKLIPAEDISAYVTTITNVYIDPDPGGVVDPERPEIHKTIDYLGDGGNNTDTALRGEDYYRLYLDVQTAAVGKEADLLLVLDNSGSMFADTLRIEGKLRNTVLREVLNELIPEFLAANPENRISTIYFSGPAKAYNWPIQVPKNFTEGDVADDAWLTQEWTNDAQAAIGSLATRCRIVDGTVGGGTNYAQALLAAGEQIEKSLAAGRTPYVLFLSDGVPTYYIQSNGQRGGNGKDPSGMSIMHDFYNVAKRNAEACIQPTLDAIAAFQARYPDITLSVIGLSSSVQEAHMAILTQMPYNGGFYQYATSEGALESALRAMLAAVETTNVTVTDELSAYVRIPTGTGAQPDYLVTMTEVSTGTQTVLYQNGAVTPRGQGIVQSVGYTAGNTPDSTGKISLKFVDQYVLDSDYRYTLSFNVEVTPDAYAEFASSGYGGVTGEAGTDYPLTNNATSSGQPGFRSNKSAYVDYTLDGTPHTDYYKHPVVQVQTVTLTVGKSVVNGDLQADFAFEVVFTDSNGDPYTAILAGSGYTVDQTAGKIAFTLKHGQSVTVAGLAKNLTAVLRELNHDGYTVLIKEGDQTLCAAESGTLLLTTDREITVVNNAGITLPETGGGGAPYTGVWRLCSLGLYLATVATKKRGGLCFRPPGQRFWTSACSLN